VIISLKKGTVPSVKDEVLNKYRLIGQNEELHNLFRSINNISVSINGAFIFLNKD
jgi:hypothetical protein